MSGRGVSSPVRGRARNVAGRRRHGPHRRGPQEPEAERQGRPVDWTTGALELIDLRSFTSIWYWIMVAVVWSTAAHWTLGVPYDAVTRARRAARRGDDPEAQADLEMLVRANCNRILMVMDLSGAWVVGFAFFVLSILALLGFRYGVEFAQAVFLIVAPLSLVMALSVRLARRIRAEAPTGEALRRRISRQRFLNQVIGMISIFVTAFWGMWHNLSATVL